MDKHAVATLERNRPDWNVAHGDVKDLDFRSFAGHVDLVEGGFPCQAFSYAGSARGFADTRGTLFFQFARAVQETLPKVFIGENVKGLISHDKGRTLRTMLETLRHIKTPDGIGYKFAYRVVRSQYLDVPQKRERFMLIGVREDVGNRVYFPKERDYVVTLKEAIGDRPESPGQSYSQAKKKILDLVPPGGYWKDLPKDIQREYMGKALNASGGKTSTARRLQWNQPSLTLTCSPSQKQTERCHPDETRPLNVREYARIQTFPDDWVFDGGLTAAYKQIGNAVPVNLGFYFGQCAIATMSGNPNEYVELADDKEYAG